MGQAGITLCRDGDTRAAALTAGVPILSLQAVTSAEHEDYALERLLEECSISTNTAAAGVNASLMTIG